MTRANLKRAMRQAQKRRGEAPDWIPVTADDRRAIGYLMRRLNQPTPEALVRHLVYSMLLAMDLEAKAAAAEHKTQTEVTDDPEQPNVGTDPEL